MAINDSKPVEIGAELSGAVPQECKACPETIAKMRFDARKWRELHHLMLKLKGTEYVAYLLGSNDADGIPHVHDYYIPTQEVSAATADVTEDVLPDAVKASLIGWLHSHHTMGAFHSGRDEQSMNYPINIVISTKGYIATYRAATTCGRIIRSTDIPIEFSEEEVCDIIPGEEKIKRTFQYAYAGINMHGLCGCGGGARQDTGFQHDYQKDMDDIGPTPCSPRRIATKHGKPMKPYQHNTKLLKVGMQ